MDILAIVALILQLTMAGPSTVIVSFDQADPKTDALRVWGGVDCTWLSYSSITCTTPAGAESLKLSVQMDCSIKTAFLKVRESGAGGEVAERIVYVDNDNPNCKRHYVYFPWVPVTRSNRP